MILQVLSPSLFFLFSLIDGMKFAVGKHKMTSQVNH